MTIEGQIKDEKLQYDINREDVKISALSSGKIDNYEYLPDEEIAPAGKQQMIETAKFTYSPLGKAFEKQIKTIEDQGKKQVEALANLKPKDTKPIEEKPNEYSNYFLNGLAKTRESTKPIDYNNLIYYYKGNSAPTNFIDYKGPMSIFKKVHNGDINLEDTEEEQINFKRKLAQIKQGNPQNRSKEQEKTINNATNLYNSRQQVVKMFNDYAKSMSRNIYESKHTEPSYAGPSYAGLSITKQKKVVSEDSSGDEPLYEEKQASISRDIHSGVIMNERKKLGISDEKLVDFDVPIDLYTNLLTKKISINDAEEEQDKTESLLDELFRLDKNKLSKKQIDVINILNNYFNNREEYIATYLDDIKKTKKAEKAGKGLKILTPNQMLKRLPIALAQIKAGNNSESLLNEIRQIAYSFYRSKEITKKVYNNIIKSIKV